MPSRTWSGRRGSPGATSPPRRGSIWRAPRTQEARARVSAMEADLATARLPARDDQIAAAVAEVAMREAALAQAHWELDQRTVRAPMAAIVDDRVRDSGEWVDAGGIVVSLLPPDKVKVRFFVPEPELGAIHVGQEVDLRCDGCAPGMTGTVRFIAPEAEYTPPVIYSVGSRGKLVFMVEAWPAAGITLNPGQPVDVRPAMSPVIDARGLVKRFGTRTVVDHFTHPGRARPDLRLPRPQRQRQDHDHPHAVRAADARRAAAAPASATTSSRRRGRSSARSAT